ncbi:MAG: hypothetical protein NXI21_10600 [Alphaproteobacteria bacterium]|nr:hypothetical protein [Alphaproteobacteria bacterium]
MPGFDAMSPNAGGAIDPSNANGVQIDRVRREQRDAPWKGRVLAFA